MISQQTNYAWAERVEHVPQSFIREVLKVASDPAIISFAGGLPNPSFFPIKELEECALEVLRENGKQVLQYAATDGLYSLRTFIANRYQQQGLSVSPEQVLITNGSQQALDLIGKLFIDPGDNVLLERPSYLGAIQCFSVFQPQFTEVPLLQDGPCMDTLKSVMNKKPAKLFYCIPNFQNPTGLQYSLEKRTQVTQLLSQYETLIVEDDPYGDINFASERLPTLYSYLPEQTILLGSFSKTVAPGLRVGWMVANEAIIKKAILLKQAADLHSANLPQYILSTYLHHYPFNNHLQVIIQQYKKQRDVMLNCFQTYFPAEVNVTKPGGGMFTWLTLPKQITARQLLDRAIKEGIVFVPGDCFYVNNLDMHTARLNYSNVPESIMRKAMETLGQLVKEELVK
jgi:2-aminoadipate transaminase